MILFIYIAHSLVANILLARDPYVLLLLLLFTI